AQARREGRALEDHRARVPVRESLDPRVLLAEADAAGKQHDGGGEVEPAEREAQRARLAMDFAGHVRTLEPAHAHVYSAARPDEPGGEPADDPDDQRGLEGGP